MSTCTRSSRISRWSTARGLAVGVGLAALVAAPEAARGDVVYLRNGQQIEGKVSETAHGVRVEFESGRIVLDRRDVLRIERRLLVGEEYEARLRALDPLDADGARRLARWCEARGLLDEASAMRERAQQAALEGLLAAADPTDPEALVDVAGWARAQGYPEAARREVLAMATAIDPDHAEARALLGHERFRGEWRTQEEVERIRFAEESQAMRAEGYVRYAGAWMRPEEARLYQVEAQLDLAREQLAKEREAITHERAEMAALRASLEQGLAALDRDRRELASLRESLARESRELARAPNVNGSFIGTPLFITRRRVVRVPDRCDDTGRRSTAPRPVVGPRTATQPAPRCDAPASRPVVARP